MHYTHLTRVNAVKFSYDGRYVMSIGNMDDGNVVVFDLEKKKVICGTFEVNSFELNRSKMSFYIFQEDKPSTEETGFPNALLRPTRETMFGLLPEMTTCPGGFSIKGTIDSRLRRPS